MAELIFTFPILLAIFAIFDPNRKPIRCSEITSPANACALESYGETACFREISGLLEYNRKNIMDVCIPEIKPENIFKRGEHTIYMQRHSESILRWDAASRLLKLCEENTELGVMHITNKKGDDTTYSIKGFCVTSEESKKQ